MRAEPDQLLVKQKTTGADVRNGASINQLFEEQVERSPMSVAALDKDEQLTYSELNQRANQLAHHLQTLGVGVETLCGIYVERSIRMLVGVLAILKAGGAYVPLDPSYPLARLAFMLEDARPLVLLTEKHLAETLPEHDAKVVLIDEVREAISNENVENPANDVTSNNLAYVIYTSGSTGTPKGVLGLHRGAINRFRWMWETYPFEAYEISCQKTALSFVDSVWELFGPLLQGVATVIIPDDVLKDTRRLVEHLSRERVTRIVLVPSLLNTILETHDDLQARLPSLKIWVSSGEALSAGLARRFKEAMPHSTLLNLYGSSEVAADATWFDTSSEDFQAFVPIGRPIANIRAYVLDEELRPVTDGERGELYIAGDGLARGYLRRPDLTAERFISDPFSDEAKASMYKTGDIARLMPDGNLEFLGRADHQVKIRGFRIELGEIEAAMRRHSAVGECVVIAREDAASDKRLVAYVVSKQAEAVASHELRAFLKESLPDYMLPAAFVMLDALPLTPNGKVDRLALPAPDTERPQLSEAYKAPSSKVEKELTAIWEELLTVRPIGTQDNFFEIGGDSLLAVNMLIRVEEVFGKNVSPSSLIQEGTIEHLARIIAAADEGKAWSPLVEIQAEGTRPPLFFVHPIGGEVFGYGALGRLLGPEQPFYGLQARGLDGKQEPLTKLEAMASYYIDEVLKVQAEGPFLLGGYSFGGIVAFEMAQQLYERGHRVAFLAILDEEAPNPPGRKWSPTSLANIARNLPYWTIDHVLRRPKREVMEAVERHMKRLAKGVGSRFGRLGIEPHQANVGDLLNVSQLPDTHRRVSEALFQALIDYRARVYPGRITLFRTRAQSLFCRQGSDKGWQRLTTAGVEVKLVPGNHINMYDHPYVQVLAEQMKYSLEAIFEREQETHGKQTASSAEEPRNASSVQRLGSSILSLPLYIYQLFLEML